MSLLIHVDSHEILPTSILERGRIEFGVHTVVYADERPHELKGPEPFVLETGLAAGIGSLECARKRISDIGYRAIAVGHTHHDRSHPIRHNAEDIEAVVEALTGEEKVHCTGLSRGWPAQVLATKHMPDKVVSLTAIAPAMMAPVNPIRIMMLGAEVARETVRNPREFGRVLLDSARTVKQRPDVTAVEAVKLLFGHVHKRVEELRLTQSGVHFHLAASVRDGFFDERILERIARELQFDTYYPHRTGTAGHGAFAYSTELVDAVVETATTYKKDSLVA